MSASCPHSPDPRELHQPRQFPGRQANKNSPMHVNATTGRNSGSGCRSSFPSQGLCVQQCPRPSAKNVPSPRQQLHCCSPRAEGREGAGSLPCVQRLANLVSLEKFWSSFSPIKTSPLTFTENLFSEVRLLVTAVLRKPLAHLCPGPADSEQVHVPCLPWGHSRQRPPTPAGTSGRQQPGARDTLGARAGGQRGEGCRHSGEPPLLFTESAKLNSEGLVSGVWSWGDR